MTGLSPTGLASTGLTADISAGTGDITAPVLSLPTGTNTGKYSAIGSVSTDESGGTLYYVTNTSASASSATVKAGGNQTVVATGVQNITITGLTANTGYYNHFLHRDAAGNDSAVASSAQWFTEAEAAPSGVVTITSVTVGATTASVTYNYSDIDATGFEYRIDGGAAVTATASPQALTGLTTLTTYGVEMRAINLGGVSAWSAPYEFTTTDVTLPEPTGTPAQDIPSTGTDGPALLYKDIALVGALPTDLMRAEIIVPPPVGTLTMNADSSFTYTGPSTTFTYEGFINDVSYGTGVVTLTTGG